MKGKITVIGLGSSDENHLSLGVYRLLKETNHLYLRTKEHPLTSFLEKEGIVFKTFDSLYDNNTEYEKVYQEIAAQLLEAANAGEIVIYGVPGHPMVAEKSVQYLLDQGEQQGIEVEIVGGESFLDTIFSSLKIDPIDGFIFINGEVLIKKDLDPNKNIVIGQVYDQWVASDVKLTLMEIYPDEAPVYIAANLGIKGKEVIKEIPLYQLDYDPNDFHHLSSVYVPPFVSTEATHGLFDTLEDIVRILRSPDGCPWDRKQTHQSIRQNLIEETYELVETIDSQDMEHMVEELGDVLLQIMLHSQIATEEGYFTINDVIKQLNNKLVRRHPHVFGEEKAEKAEDAYQHWQQIKQQEKAEKGIIEGSHLDGIPVDLPAVLKAFKLQKKAARVGFDWDKIESVYDKIQEEITELKVATEDQQIAELGDLLFAVINLARFLDADPEQALALTNQKFIQRFQYIERKLKENKVEISEASLEEMERYWNEAKSVEGEML